MAHKTLKFKFSIFSLMFAFSLFFGPKHNYTIPTTSESAKDFVRVSVLEEKLDLWGKLQFAVYQTFKYSIFHRVKELFKSN